MERTGTGSVIGARVGTTLARLVGSVSAAVITRVPTTERIIYLTIDDGPSENTLPLLDALDAEDVQATWFVAGENVARNPDTVREVLSRGHRVGLHGYRHLDAWRNRWELVRSDMEASRSQLNRIAGYESYMVRPPFGRLRPALLKWCRRRGDRVVLWDVLAPDFSETVPISVVGDALVSTCRTGSIIAMHDHDGDWSGRVISHCITLLKREGWRFAKLPSGQFPRG